VRIGRGPATAARAKLERHSQLKKMYEMPKSQLLLRVVMHTCKVKWEGNPGLTKTRPIKQGPSIIKENTTIK
jgi:hypothetical protein